jgi:hypothetical protein
MNLNRSETARVFRRYSPPSKSGEFRYYADFMLSSNELFYYTGQIFACDIFISILSGNYRKLKEIKMHNINKQCDLKQISFQIISFRYVMAYNFVS